MCHVIRIVGISMLRKGYSYSDALQWAKEGTDSDTVSNLTLCPCPSFHLFLAFEYQCSYQVALLRGETRLRATSAPSLHNSMCSSAGARSYKDSKSVRLCRVLCFVVCVLYSIKTDLQWQCFCIACSRLQCRSWCNLSHFSYSIKFTIPTTRPFWRRRKRRREEKGSMSYKQP